MNDKDYCGAKLNGACNSSDKQSSDYKGQKCVGGQICSSGSCVCPSDLVLCNGNCIDPASDSAYCGARGDCKNENSGDVCTDGKTCVKGVCSQVSATCSPEKTLCPGNVCKNLNTDNQNCHYCGFSCPQSTPYCVTGNCVECNSDENCNNSTKGKKCDTTRKECVQCLSVDDCKLGANQEIVICNANQCKVNKCKAGFYIEGDVCVACTQPQPNSGQIATSDGMDSNSCAFSCDSSNSFHDCRTESNDLICLKKGWGNGTLDSDDCNKCIRSGCTTGQTCNRSWDILSHTYSCSNTQ